jgi:hypothetical protein
VSRALAAPTDVDGVRFSNTSLRQAHNCWIGRSCMGCSVSAEPDEFMILQIADGQTWSENRSSICRSTS